MSIKNFFKRRKCQLLSILILLILIRLFFFKFPLFRNLDLEIAIVYSFIFSILSSFLTLYSLNHNEKLVDLVLSKLILITFVFVVFLLFDLVVNQCSLTNGIFFFPTFVTTSTAFGFFLALLTKSLGKIKSYLVLSLIFLILILYSLVEYYFEPQLFLFNPIIIFFPGLVYNEIFELNWKILVYVLTLFISSSLVIIYHLLKEKNHLKYLKKFELHLKILPLIILSLLFLLAEWIGLNTSQTKLKSYFSTKIVGEDYEIYLEAPLNKEYKVEILRSTVEFHYRYLKELTGFAPSKIQIFIFQNDNSKKLLLGDEVADFTKPWLKQIFVTEKSFSETIKHELAHIFLGENSTNIFRVSDKFNLGLIEGGAMALEWEWLENSPRYFAALIDRFIGNFKADDFFSNYSFATRQSYLAYIMSGAFCKYLIDNYSLKKFLVFYKTGDFNSTYLKSLDTEFFSFLKSLRKINFTTDDSLRAVALFGGKSFLEKKCPRSFARINREAFDLINKQKLSDAEKIFLSIYESRKDIEAFSNFIRVKFLQKKYDDVINLYNNSEFKNKLNGIASFRTQIFYALSLRKKGELIKAKEILNQLKKINLSSGWNAYLDMLLLFLDYPELIDKLSMQAPDLLSEIKDAKIPDKWIFWKNFIDAISTEEIKLVVLNSLNEFWILKKCFYRYLQLGNFVEAKRVVDLIYSNNLVSNEIEEYQFGLMSYIIQNIIEDEI